MGREKNFRPGHPRGASVRVNRCKCAVYAAQKFFHSTPCKTQSAFGMMAATEGTGPKATNNEETPMTMTAEERIEAAKNYTVGTKVYAGRHGMTGRCTIVRIGPPPPAGQYGADWATATYDVRDERGATLLGAVATDLTPCER